MIDIYTNSKGENQLIKKRAMTLITAHLFFNLIQYPKSNLNYGPIIGGQVTLASIVINIK